MSKFQNKYRNESARAQWWNYGDNAAYFITICTQHREHYFGEIIQNKDIKRMDLNEMGQIALNYWSEIPHHFPYAKLGAFIVMPNHVHGIIIIDKPNQPASSVVGTRLIASLPPQRLEDTFTTEPIKGGVTGNKNPMMHDNISRIIRWYKGRCTFEIRKNNPQFTWQSRFHDHIIRTDESYQKIHNYIENNVLNWNSDQFFEK